MSRRYAMNIKKKIQIFSICNMENPTQQPGSLGQGHCNASSSS